jgi:hypothetical protein
LSTTPEEDIEKQKKKILKAMEKRNKKKLAEYRKNKEQEKKFRNTKMIGDEYQMAIGTIDSSFNDVSLAINDTLNASDQFDGKKENVVLIKTNISNIQCSNFRVLKDKMFILTWLTMLIGYFIPHVALFTFKPLGASLGLKPNFLDAIGNVASVFNALSRFAIGLIFKNKSYF